MPAAAASSTPAVAQRKIAVLAIDFVRLADSCPRSGRTPDKITSLGGQVPVAASRSSSEFRSLPRPSLPRSLLFCASTGSVGTSCISAIDAWRISSSDGVTAVQADIHAAMPFWMKMPRPCRLAPHRDDSVAARRSCS
jgi:hypothetical protein